MYQQNLFVALRVNMLQQLHLPVIQLVANTKGHHLKLLNLFNIAKNNINSILN